MSVSTERQARPVDKDSFRLAGFVVSDKHRDETGRHSKKPGACTPGFSVMRSFAFLQILLS
jgi:hypothetical protein